MTDNEDRDYAAFKYWMETEIYDRVNSGEMSLDELGRAMLAFGATHAQCDRLTAETEKLIYGERLQ